MPYKKRVRWVEKLKSLQPEEGTITESLLKIGQAIGFIVLTKLDEVWCTMIPPDRRQSDSGNQKQGE